MKSCRRLIGGMLLFLLMSAPVFCQTENLKVLVVLSEQSAPYQSFTEVLKKALPALQITVLKNTERLITDMPGVDLLITVGMKASELAATQSKIPVLAVMIPRAGYENLLSHLPAISPPRLMSAIYLDQPWARRIEFWHAVIPERRKIGLVFTQNSNIELTYLHHEIEQRGGSLILRQVHSNEELFSVLESILMNSDVLIAIADSEIYNSSNIRNILLSSYRHGVPLIGLSQAYVNAGALCAIFSTPEQLAIQASKIVIAFARHKDLPEAQYPEDYTIAVNQQVARSLGIEMRSAETIHSQMNKAKEERE
jgi:putative ABC transport system substrate-binding protein